MWHAVPCFPGAGILQSEVSRQIDDPDSLLQKIWNGLHGGSIRRRKEYSITRMQPGVLGITVSQIDLAAETREHFRNFLATLTPGRDCDQLGVWMYRQQTHELHAGIPRRPNQPDSNRVHENA